MPQPLTDAELDELGSLLDATPPAFEPMDVVTLDGYLCGVLVQPRVVESAQWLPAVFDVQGRPLPADVDGAWLARTRSLIERHHDALRAYLAQDGGFGPVLPEQPLPAPEEDPHMSEASRLLWPWVAGFAHAQSCHPELLEWPDDDLDEDLDRLWRHLPVETVEQLELRAELDASWPLASTDDAVDDLVDAVARLAEATEPLRYHVPPRRRDQPKVGRNDPCPCGSGRKFKLCHGAG